MHRNDDTKRGGDAALLSTASGRSRTVRFAAAITAVTLVATGVIVAATGQSDPATATPQTNSAVERPIAPAVNASSNVRATEAIAAAKAEANRRTNRKTRANIAEQGGGDVYTKRGAKLTRQEGSLGIRWTIKTPEPGSYDYPAPDMLPPGQPEHPPVEPGDLEVFTLWAFVFNHPELCSETCGPDDLGDTPAKGGAYQVDATLGDRPWINMRGDLWLTQAPLLGAPLTNPKGAEVHVAMAPHGAARTGAELTRQLNGPIGNSAFWWTAVFAE